MTAGTAHAIGLSEINVHSALGQPLQASIALLGGKNLSADCIKLQALGEQALPMPPTLKFELKEAFGKPSELWLSTSQAMHEPALGVTVILLCDASLQRDYAILLDVAQPAPHEEASPEPSGAGGQAGHAAPPNRRSVANPGKLHRTAQPATSGIKPSRTANAPKFASRAVLPQPRLTLSGTRLFRVDSEQGLPLKLDLSLPDPGRIPDKPLSETGRLDDSAALNHKLAHLEQQLRMLQQRNAELTHRTQFAAAQITLTQTDQSSTGASLLHTAFRAVPQWLYVLLGVLLLSGAVAWLLIRRSHIRHQYDEDDYAIVPTPQRDSSIRADSTAVTLSQDGAMHDLAFATQSGISGQSPTSASLEWPKKEDVVELDLTHDDLDLAIQLLEEGIHQNPHASPASWLTLLDFLHSRGDMVRYGEALDSVKRLFNINIPAIAPFAADHPPLAQSRGGLESYPHVLSELLRLWPGANTANFLEALLRDTRGGTRTGLDFQSFQEIQLLLDILKQSGAFTEPDKHDFSNIRDLRR